MQKTKTIKTLAAALVAFQGEVTNPVNTRMNEEFNSGFAPLEEIINHLRPLLNKHGLLLFHNVGGDGEKVKITAVLMHQTGESIETDPLEIGHDITPASIASAITTGRRITLLSLLGLQSEDNVNKDIQKENPKPATKTTSKKINKQQNGEIYKLRTELKLTHDDEKAVLKSIGYNFSQDILQSDFEKAKNAIRQYAKKKM